MSDFLSNFTGDKYKKEPLKTDAQPEEQAKPRKDTVEKTTPVELAIDLEQTDEKQTTRRATRHQQEETEFDPSYKKKQQKKYLWIGLSSILVLLFAVFTYYQVTHVRVPDFSQKELSEVRAWGTEEGVLIQVEQTYDFAVDVNQVITQSTPANKKIRKGKTLKITASLGANPEDKIALPDFEELTKEQAQEWIETSKAQNVSILEEYSDTIAEGKFMKQELADKALNLEEYRRKDRMVLYYSKGKEVFEKNIAVLDFKGQDLESVTEWAKKNSIRLKTKKQFSKTVAKDHVIGQEPTAGTLMAKKETLVIQISKGEAVVIPDYSKYTMENATEAEPRISVMIKNVYSETIPYGRFINQSVKAGKQYNEEGEIPTVEVTYSEGKPYIQDLRGSTNEGDLPKLFYDQYQSKGANVTYQVYYVNSVEPKGTVVDMSHYGQFLPLNTTIQIGISRGNLQNDIDNNEHPTED